MNSACPILYLGNSIYALFWTNLYLKGTVKCVGILWWHSAYHFWQDIFRSKTAFEKKYPVLSQSFWCFYSIKFSFISWENSGRNIYSQGSYLSWHLLGGTYNKILQAYHQLAHQIIGRQVYFVYLKFMGGHSFNWIFHKRNKHTYFNIQL